MIKFRPAIAGALALLLCAALNSCGDSPSDPSSNPTPTPAPTPAPTPTPTPVPTPTPKAVCVLADVPIDCGFGRCCRQGGERMFDPEIAAAQADLARTNPEIFDSRGRLEIGEKEYTDLLADRIVQMSGGTVCSIGSGGSTSRDEIRVKRNNDIAQHVDVIVGSTNTPWVGGRYTCRPSSF